MFQEKLNKDHQIWSKLWNGKIWRKNTKKNLGRVCKYYFTVETIRSK